MRMYLAAVLVILGVMIMQESTAQTNCNVGTPCFSCPNRTILIYKRGGRYYWTVVCCKSCSKYYRAGVVRPGGDKDDIPYCTCDYDRMGGNCMKGDACASCTRKFNVNRMPVCCPNCANSTRITVNSTLCNCQ